jgi:hypothetical protein
LNLRREKSAPTQRRRLWIYGWLWELIKEILANKSYFVILRFTFQCLHALVNWTWEWKIICYKIQFSTLRSFDYLRLHSHLSSLVIIISSGLINLVLSWGEILDLLTNIITIGEHLWLHKRLIWLLDSWRWSGACLSLMNIRIHEVSFSVWVEDFANSFIFEPFNAIEFGYI